MLGIIALACLLCIQHFPHSFFYQKFIVKKYIEKDRRKLSVWFMDTAKIAVGAVFVHMYNLVIAYFMSKMDSQEEKSD
jgi:hypothetical protein